MMSDGRRVHLIGDPHLGKAFGEEQGVPRHRRGERELSQALQFERELDEDADIVVMVGDLFDTPFVSKGVVVAAARAMLGAAERNPDVLFVAMAGNHDKPRNLTVVGAWHTFREIAQGRLDNLLVLDAPYAVAGLAFFPWEWDRRAADQVADVAQTIGVEAAIGHWDLSVFDGKDEHLAPAALLREAFGEDVTLWSGHYHVPGRYGEVNCVGSMQPYTHGEDPEGRLYVTLTLAEALARDDLHDKVVRVLLAPGEDEPEIDCLGLTHKRVRPEVEEEGVDLTQSLETFDFPRIVRNAIADLHPQVRGFIEERMSINAPAAEEQR
jgi:hypothetical protein